jgi:hypothetical protein
MVPSELGGSHARLGCCGKAQHAKRSVPLKARIMDIARKEPLARTGFAFEKDGQIEVGCALRQCLGTLHFGRNGDHFGKIRRIVIGMPEIAFNRFSHTQYSD